MLIFQGQLLIIACHFMTKIKASIIGGSGYAGGELIRLLLFHPKVEIQQVTSRRYLNEPIGLVHPNLRGLSQLTFTSIDKLQPADVIFIALPNGNSMAIFSKVKPLARKIIDLGADFRLNQANLWQTWYRQEHQRPDLLTKFVYGLPEVNRQAIRQADWLACGGCEAMVSILTLYPVIKQGLIETDDIIIDAKMSSSQVGSQPSWSSHHPERSGVVRSYKPTGHRHTAEIEEQLSVFSHRQVKVSVSATSLDMVRGILVTIHTKPKRTLTDKDVWQAYRQVYSKEPFIRIIKQSRGLYRYPEPKILQGSNYCDIGFELDKHNNRLVLIGAIDNLMKGTAGTAVQSLNIMFGFDETLGLKFPGLHPV